MLCNIKKGETKGLYTHFHLKCAKETRILPHKKCLLTSYCILLESKRNKELSLA